MEKPQTTQAQKAVREPLYTTMTQFFFWKSVIYNYTERKLVISTLIQVQQQFVVVARASDNHSLVIKSCYAILVDSLKENELFSPQENTFSLAKVKQGSKSP